MPFGECIPAGNGLGRERIDLIDFPCTLCILGRFGVHGLPGSFGPEGRSYRVDVINNLRAPYNRTTVHPLLRRREVSTH